MKNVKKIKHKGSFTLLEVMITLMITGILVSLLWQSFVQTQRQKVSLEAFREITIRRISFYQKISNEFLSLSLKGDTSPILANKELQNSSIHLVSTHLYTDDPDPNFCSEVQVAIVLKENTLYLVKYGKNKTYRTEPLWENVKKIDLQFYDPHTKTWLPTWDKAQKYPPAMIKFSFFSNYLEEFVFSPSQLASPIAYPVKNLS